MRSKESGKVRYAYGVTMALLLGGTAFSLATGQAGAQIPQNAPGTAALAPRAGAPMSFADLVAKLQSLKRQNLFNDWFDGRFKAAHITVSKYFGHWDPDSQAVV